MFNILVVEDNRDLRELLCDALTGEGYRAYSSSDGNEALTRLEETFFDLIIADIMMPNMDGLQLTEELRRAGIDTPILIVTARDDYETLQSGFTLGADDYMVKPVNVNELLLRVKALLRRAKINTDKKITVGSTVLDFETMSVAVKEEKTELPLKEFQLLFKLLSYPDKIFTRQQLMDEIWGLDSDTYDRTLNTHINRLRERFSLDSIVRAQADIPADLTYKRHHKPQELLSAYLSMLGKKKPPEPQKPEDTISKLITRRVVSVASQIVFVLRSLWKKRHVSLKELFRGKNDPSERVAAFLAVLELVKDKRLRVDGDGEDCEIKLTNGGE